MKDYYNVEFSEDRKTLVRAPKDLSGEYVVPEGVVVIGPSAFSGCSSLNKIILPFTLNIIGGNAFNDCKALTSVYYNGNLEDWLLINSETGFQCSHRFYLKENGEYTEAVSLIIPEDVEEIRQYAFYYCRSVHDVKFHDGILAIGDCAFNKSEIAGDIVLPPNLSSLGEYCFLSCKRLTSVYIPDSVTEIKRGCFAYCDNLRRLEVDRDNSMFTSSSNLNAIFDKFQTKLIACAPAGPSFLLLSRTCQSVLDYAFVGCRIEQIFLRNITFPVTNVKDCKSIFYVPAGTKQHYVKMGFPEEQVLEECDGSKLFKKGGLEIIYNNPFRTLGVCANDSARAIASNATRIKRYAEVGKSVSFPMDALFEPPVARDGNSADNATAAVNLPNDRIKYAMFWFGRPEDEDNAIFKQIMAKQWKEIPGNSLQLRDNYPDGLNRALAKYIGGSTSYFVTSLLGCVKSEKFRKAFLQQVCDDSEYMDEDTLLHIALDSLLEGCDVKQLYALLRIDRGYASETQYVKNKVVGEYTSSIYADIQRAKNIDADDSVASFSAAKALIAKTKEPLEKVSEFLGKSDSQYVVIADALAKQILQSGINYFNSSFESDAPYKAFEVQSYAAGVAKGKLVKQRCEENLEILRKIIRTLPPQDMLDFDRRLRAFIDTYEDVYATSGSLDNLENALNGFGAFSPELQEYNRTHPSEEDKRHFRDYVAKTSTRFADSVLAELIDIFNKSMKESNTYSSGVMSSVRLEKKKSLVNQAWKIITMLGCVPMDMEYKTKRYQPNRDTLGKMYDDFILGIPQSSSGPSRFNAPHRPITNIDMRSELEVFNACKSGRNYCDVYLRRHPNGVYLKDVMSLIDNFDWSECSSISDLRNYLKKHKNGHHASEAEHRLEVFALRDRASWENCKDLKSYEQYLAEFPEGAYRKQAEEKVQSIKSKITTFQVVGAFIIVGLLIVLLAI